MSLNINLGLKDYILGGLGAFLLISNAVWYVKWDNQRDGWNAEKAAHTQTKDNYKKAQLEAALKSTEKARQEEKKNAEASAKASAVYGDLLRKYNASLLRYQAQTAVSPPGTIHLSGTSETTVGTSRSRESTDIYIPLEDAKICATNTAKAQAWLDWYYGTQK